MNNNGFPASTVPAVDRDGRFTTAWLRFLQSLVASSEPIQSLTVGASPWSYQAPSSGNALITGGTVSDISISRGGATVSTGLLSGFVPASAGDVVTVTYAVAPTVSFVPN